MSLAATWLDGTVELLPGVCDETEGRQLAALARWYNRLLGPITAVNVIRPEPLDLSLHAGYCHHSPVVALLPDVHVKTAPHTRALPGGGKGVTPLHAVLGALGEMSERLLATLRFGRIFDEVVYATHRDLDRDGVRAVGPEELPLFAPEQYAAPDFEHVPFTEDTLLGWVAGRDLLDDSEVWVPAQLVLMYYKEHPAEPSIGYATTAGLAARPRREAAILHGLYEVVERDALNVSWYSRLAPPRVEVDVAAVLAAASGADPAQLRAATPYVEPAIYDMTLDTPVPVLAAIAYDRSRDERCFLGGTGGGGTRERALLQSLCELGQCQTGFRFDDPFGRNPILPTTGLDEVVEFFDAPLWYGYPDNLELAYWFTASPHVRAWEDVTQLGDVDDLYALGTMLDWLRGSGLRPVVLDMSDPEDEVAITKVYVPQLTHACPPRDPMLGHPRFGEVPVRLGRAERPLSYADLYPYPIPFA